MVELTFTISARYATSARMERLESLIALTQ